MPLEQLSKLAKVVLIDIGYCPIAHAGGFEVGRVVATFTPKLDRTFGANDGRLDEDIDNVLTIAVDNSCGGLTSDVIQSSAGEHKPFSGKVVNRRRKI